MSRVATHEARRGDGAGRAAAASIVRWTVRVGLVGGWLFGWAQSLALGWPLRPMLGARQWIDVLGYSGAGHALVWTAYGLALGLAGAALGRARRADGTPMPEAYAVAVFAAGATIFLLWPAAWFSGVGMARGIEARWLLLMLTVWCLVAFAVHALARRLFATRAGDVARRLLRLALWPALVVTVIGIAIQWTERPRLREPDARAAAPPERAGADLRPHVVWIVLDTQRVDRLGCYGYDRPTTPHLDSLAADARVFENCLSPAIWTLPSHASMFTGLFPSEHGTHDDHRWLDDGFVTVAELLREAGYETIAFSNNTWVSNVTNVMQGFDEVVRPATIHHARGNSLSEFVDKVLYPAGLVGRFVGTLTAEDVGARFTNQLVARWLDEREPDRPFFLFLNYMEPHDPYRPHLPHRRLFVPRQEIGRSYRARWDRGVEFSLLRRESYTPDELRLLGDVYDAETRLLDDHVGELVEILSRTVPLDDALLIVTADHGENLGDHHLLGHAHCVYDTLAHVPLILRYPRRLGPGRSDELVQTTDLLPTVLDAVHGAAMPTPSTFGRSLLQPAEAAAEEGAAAEERVAVVERITPQTTLHTRDVRFDGTPYRGVLRAIRRGPWKYIVAANGREELYRIDADPGEIDNVVEHRREIADALADRLAAWLAASRPYDGSEPLEGERVMDDETRARLRALGYLR